MGIDVYVQYTKPPAGSKKSLTFAKLPSKLQTGWTHVRHVSAAAKKWHPTNDDLKGTAAYGTASTSNTAAPWSVKYNIANVKEFMFATGTGNKWVSMAKKEVWANSSYAKCYSSYSTSTSQCYTFYYRSSGYAPRICYKTGNANYSNLYIENSYTSDLGN